MKKYMLTRGQKKAGYVGFRRESVNGRLITIKVEVVMEPGRVYGTEFDMDHWVSSGVMVEVSEIVEPKTVTAVSPDKDPDVELVEDDDELIGDSEGEEVVDDEEDDEELKPSYEEMEDGSFRCLICESAGEEKVLKTEKNMQIHIDKKH